MTLTQTLRSEYDTLFQTCTVRPEFSDNIENVITRSITARRRYQAVALRTRVPWHVVAVIHNLECSGRFDCHLHNGDSLSRRTVHVPAGRPVEGTPPFTWEDSAVDALRYQGFTSWTDWSVAGTLYKIETYNGLGYRKRGLRSPYLWSGSQHYTKGKYVADGKFDANAVSSQAGAAVVLRRIAEKDLIRIGVNPGAAPQPLASPVWPSDDASPLSKAA
ncbi:MAG: peptidoglycan-binding protein [Thermoanaerobaculia bacterium]